MSGVTSVSVTTGRLPLRRGGCSDGRGHDFAVGERFAVCNRCERVVSGPAAPAPAPAPTWPQLPRPDVPPYPAMPWVVCSSAPASS